MQTKKHKKKTIKPKNRFTLCCFCLGSSTSDINLNAPFGQHEAYDYVVEKLSIKRVPITLFATDEDLEEMQNINSSNNYNDYRITPRDKKSATVFSSYYSMIPKTGKNGDLLTENKINLFQGKINKNVVKENKPANIEKVIETKCKNVTGGTNDNTHVKRETVEAEIHSEPSDTKVFSKMTPEMQETLNVLGTKARPSGSPSIQARIVTRPSDENGTTNIINAMTFKHNTTFEKPTLDVYSKTKDDNKTIQENITMQQKMADQIPCSPDKIDSKESSNDACDENATPRITSSEINALLSNLSNEQNVSKASALSQKWKIIIKEHDENVHDDGTSDASSEYSSETETSETE